MHLLEIRTPIALSQNQTVPPGRYVVEDISGAQLMQIADGGQMAHMEHTSFFDRIDLAMASRQENIKSILFMRAGGFGDIILLTPVLRAAKLNHPDARIAVACFAEFAPAMKHLPFVDEVVNYPVAEDTFKSYDVRITYENSIERNPRAKEVHMTELFAEIAGVTVFDLKPELRLSENEKIWAGEAYPRRAGLRRLVVQVGASGLCRNYDRKLLGEAVGELLKKDFEVFLIGKKGEIQAEESGNLKNISAAGLTWRQTLAVVATADCVLGPDSCWIHAAGALDVPAVGLYGPFDYKLRTIHSPSIFAIQGHGPCAPCFHHAKMNRHYPKDGPCAATKRCEVLASIKPEAIVQRVLSQARPSEAVLINGVSLKGLEETR